MVSAGDSPRHVIFRVHAVQRMFERGVTVDDVRLAEAPVKCAICKQGELAPGTATVTLERGATTVVIKAVPAGICTNCGEEYIDEPTTRQIMTLADAAARTGVEIEVRQFAAA
jgi:YgiT-type zinc finger domain-containing protein